MKKLLLTPMQFYKRFGHEASRMYAQGIFLICDMFEEWRVDQNELSEIIRDAGYIDDGAITELKDILSDENPSEWHELMYTDDMGVYSIDQIKDEYERLKQLEKELNLK